MQELIVERKEILPGDYIIGCLNHKNKEDKYHYNHAYLILNIQYYVNSSRAICICNSKINLSWNLFNPKYRVLRCQ